MLTRTIATQFLQTITGWRGQVPQHVGRIQQDQLPEHRSLESGRQPANWFAGEETFRVPVGEAPNHDG